MARRGPCWTSRPRLSIEGGRWSCIGESRGPHDQQAREPTATALQMRQRAEAAKLPTEVGNGWCGAAGMAATDIVDYCYGVDVDIRRRRRCTEGGAKPIGNRSWPRTRAVARASRASGLPEFCSFALIQEVLNGIKRPMINPICCASPHNSRNLIWSNKVVGRCRLSITIYRGVRSHRAGAAARAAGGSRREMIPSPRSGPDLPI